MKHTLLLLSILFLTLEVTAQWIPRQGLDGFTASTSALVVPVSINGDGTVRAYADYNDNANGTGGVVRISRWDGNTWQRMGAREGIQSPGEAQRFGFSISLNSSGTIVAIGAEGETNINSRSELFVYQFDGEEWNLRGSPVISEQFGVLNGGAMVKISADGNRVVFAEHYHDQNIQDGTLAGPNFGIIRVFDWNGDDWSQMGNTILGQLEDERLGEILAFSADGNTIAASNYGTDLPAINVYRWDGQIWGQLGAGIVDLLETPSLIFENGSLSLDGEGNTLIVGVPNGADDGENGGHVSVLGWNGFNWTRKGNDITHPDIYAAFGNSVDISFDGETIVVGAPYHRFITPNSLDFRGFVSIYNWDGVEYQLVGNRIMNDRNNRRFGHSVAISGDGEVVNIATAHLVGLNYSRVYEYDGVVSTYTPDNSLNATLYPNPSTGNISVKVDIGGTYEIHIISIDGKIQLVLPVDIGEDQSKMLDFNSLPSGLYSVLLKNGDKVYRKKIIISR